MREEFLRSGGEWKKGEGEAREKKTLLAVALVEGFSAWSGIHILMLTLDFP